VIINQTDYVWHLAINRPSGESVRDAHVPVRATLTINLPGGDYVIAQTALSDAASPELTRKISSTLAPGQTYRWRLVTLLSETPGSFEPR